MTVTNGVEHQLSELSGYNVFTSHTALVDTLAREGGQADHGPLVALGGSLGSAEMLALADAANSHPPQLRSVDRFGARRGEVVFHPAWHQLLGQLLAAGLHTGPWAAGAAGAHIRRAAGFLLWGEIENGTQCPASMTYGAFPALARQPEHFGEWLPLLLSREYDPRFVPSRQKRGVLIGMGMTEKQGGSDVRANTSRALPAGASGPECEYRLSGHKWFLSAPMCDAFMMLAQAPGGLSCFLVPRFLPDGTVNTLRLGRLKDKLGNRSNASSEVEFEGAYGQLVGEEGRGIPTILEMGVYTRLDNAVASAGIMHQCVAQAIHHSRQRRAFGRLLVDQPLMRNVLADLAIESEAAVGLALRLARAFDSLGEETEDRLRRILTPVAKYWICKRAVAVATEAMEVLGGNGYIEEGPIARRYREAPLNSIWEGSGNIMCLDVLRALAVEPATLDALAVLLGSCRHLDARYDAFVDRLLDELARREDGELRARHLTQDIAVAAQAAALLGGQASGPAEAFIASRIAQAPPAAFGNLPAGLDLMTMIDRTLLP
jgi:putative acyl-CoA dehydrogenase